MNRLRTVLILLFDDVEVLDFAGPFEVFSVAGRDEGRRLFNVHTVAAKTPVRARGGLSINPDFDLEGAPESEIIVVPGGQGTRREIHNQGLIAWIADRAHRSELVLSVCTGSILLARAGLLRNAPATTHHSALDELRTASPTTTVLDDRRFVDNGRLVTAAGISAGIDASLHVLARLCGAAVAKNTAAHMEYDWLQET
jgi:transcriptional regulator GlxA family with amidase domain